MKTSPVVPRRRPKRRLGPGSPASPKALAAARQEAQDVLVALAIVAMGECPPFLTFAPAPAPSPRPRRGHTRTVSG
jgi:hypothetical protein